MAVKVGINGFGRIGRNFFRAAKAQGADIDFVAVNDLGSIDQMAHLLKYDSVLGVLPDDIKAAFSDASGRDWWAEVAKVWRAGDDFGIDLAERENIVAELAGLGRATGRVILRVEVEHHPFTFEI